jgi:hypothetical protein
VQTPRNDDICCHWLIQFGRVLTHDSSATSTCGCTSPVMWFISVNLQQQQQQLYV